MIPGSNLHTHTNFSDGVNTPEEMVKTAIAKGFHTLGFSEHGYAKHDRFSMKPEVEPVYRDEIRRLKEKYRDQINILLGYEHDHFSPLNVSEYDYFIESVHAIPCQGEMVIVDESRDYLLNAMKEYFGGDPYAMCREYFRTVSQSCVNNNALIIGHIELIMKFNENRDIFNDEDPVYLKYAYEMLDTVIKSGMLVEVNTGAISRGYRKEPYPGRCILRKLREMGGRVIITSDCHNADWLDCGFEQSVGIIRECGYETAWMMQGKDLVEYKL